MLGSQLVALGSHFRRWWRLRGAFLEEVGHREHAFTGYISLFKGLILSLSVSCLP
jgi:hypothetical protein